MPKVTAELGLAFRSLYYCTLPTPILLPPNPTHTQPGRGKWDSLQRCGESPAKRGLLLRGLGWAGWSSNSPLTPILGGLGQRRELDRKGEGKEHLFSSCPVQDGFCPERIMAALGGSNSLSSFHREEIKAQGLEATRSRSRKPRWGVEMRSHICGTPTNKLIPRTLSTELAKSIAGACPRSLAIRVNYCHG